MRCLCLQRATHRTAVLRALPYNASATQLGSAPRAALLQNQHALIFGTCAAQTSPATPSRFGSTHPSLLQQKREECLVSAGTDLRSTSEPGQGLAFSCISTRCPSRPGHVLPCWLQGRESKAPAASVGPSSPITCSLAPVPIHTQQGLLQAQPPAAGHISAALLPLDCHFPASLPFTSPVLDTALSESSCWPSVMGENQNGLWKKASQKGKICMILTPTFLTVTL